VKIDPNHCGTRPEQDPNETGRKPLPNFDLKKGKIKHVLRHKKRVSKY
jgi:hypothetical protein